MLAYIKAKSFFLTNYKISLKLGKYVCKYFKYKITIFVSGKDSNREISVLYSRK